MKIFQTLDEAKPLIDRWHTKNESIVLTNGCFDIFHAGHATYLNEAKACGDVLIVGLNTDDSVKRLKGISRPIMNEQQRAVVLSSLRAVDAVVLFEKDRPIDLINYIKPQFYAKGGDYKIEDLQESKAIMEHNGKIVILSYVDHLSSTSIINKLEQNK